MKVIDLIYSTPDDVSVILRGANPYDSFDAFRDIYFEGNIKDIPSKYHFCYVLYNAWDCSIQPKGKVFLIEIPYFKKVI